MWISCLPRTLLVGGLLVLPAFIVWPQVMKPASQAQAQNQSVKRALIIGNKDYRADPLANTLNDARDMAAKLRGLGFEVTLKENLPDEKAMKRAIREVTSQIRTGDVFLFYYSGHAMDVKGVNYLLPTQAEINKEVDVEYEALNFNLVLDEIEEARGQANLVILDSCRNNPFIQRAGRSANKGLAITRSPSGTYIIYATAPGKVASDNPSGRNGLFTQALLESLDTPGLTQDQVFRHTARKVRDASKGAQEPWAGGSLIDDFYFKAPSSAVAPVLATPRPTQRPVLATPQPTQRPVSLPTPQPTRAPQSKQNDTLSNSLGMAFNRIPSGSFMMGSPSNEEDRNNDENLHRVTLSQNYYMQTTEVTQAQWRTIMGTTVRQQRDKANPQWPLVGDGDNYPMYYVTWEEVQLFISKLNARGEGSYRLPTEAEWEYAARAGSATRFACGNNVICLDATDWTHRNAGNTTHPVGQKKPNAWGLYDMHGNVAEWVQDWYGDYSSAVSTNSGGVETGDYGRVIRGGDWSAVEVGMFARSSKRGYANASTTRGGYIGFRVVYLP